MTDTNVPQAEETVEIPLADDADLDAFLDTSRGQEDFDAQSEDVGDEPIEQGALDNADEVDTPKPEAAKPGDPNQELARQHEEIARLREQLVQKERFIQHRNTELGELRKENRTYRGQLEEGLREKYDLAPDEAVRDQLEIDRLKKEDQTLEVEQRSLQCRAQVDRAIQDIVYPEINQDIAAVLVQDGYDESAIRDFMSDPYSKATPGMLVNLAKRAAGERKASHWFNEFQKASAEVQRLRGKPSQVLNQVERELRRTPKMNNRADSSPKQANLSDKAIHTLSDRELEELLKNKS